MLVFYSFVVEGREDLESPGLLASDILKLAGHFPNNPAIMLTRVKNAGNVFKITVEEVRRLYEDMEEYKASQNHAIDDTPYHASAFDPNVRSTLRSVFEEMIPFLKQAIDASTNGK